MLRHVREAHGEEFSYRAKVAVLFELVPQTIRDIVCEPVARSGSCEMGRDMVVAAAENRTSLAGAVAMDIGAVGTA